MTRIIRPVERAYLADRLTQSRGFTRADLSIAAAATKAGRQPALKPVAQFAEIADRPPLLALSIAVAGVGLLRRDRKMKRAGLRMLLAVTLATSAAKAGKKLVSRTRPSKLVDEHRHAIFRGGPNVSEYNSFPSAHAAGGLKVLKGDHFPSDIIAGLAIGAVAEAIANQLIPDQTD